MRGSVCVFVVALCLGLLTASERHLLDAVVEGENDEPQATADDGC